MAVRGHRRATFGKRVRAGRRWAGSPGSSAVATSPGTAGPTSSCAVPPRARLRAAVAGRRRPSPTRVARCSASAAPTPWSVVARWSVTARPDVVARYGSTLRVKVNLGTTEIRRPIVTNVKLSGVNTILNAGDWDRDGHGDLDRPEREVGAALPVARQRRRARFESARRIGTWLRVGRAAGGGRRHDRRRLPRPDGPAARRCDADLPRAGGCPASGRATSPTAPSAPTARCRWAAGTATALPDSLFRKRREADPLPGQRPRRADRRQGAQARPVPLRLGDRHQRHRPEGPSRTWWCGRRRPATCG